MRGRSGDPIIAVVHDTAEELRRKYASVTVLGQVTDPLTVPCAGKHMYLLRVRQPESTASWTGRRSTFRKCDEYLRKVQRN